MSKIPKEDLITPANAITTLGIVLVIIGSIYLNTLGGLCAATVGKLLDIVDGKIARQTHTSSFGELYDATADKITILILLIAAYHFRLMPIWFLLFIFIYNAGISAMASHAIRLRLWTAPTSMGKYIMFLHISTMLMFILSHNTATAHHFVHPLTIALAVASVLTDSVNFTRYLRRYLATLHKLHTNNNTPARQSDV